MLRLQFGLAFVVLATSLLLSTAFAHAATTLQVSPMTQRSGYPLVVPVTIGAVAPGGELSVGVINCDAATIHHCYEFAQVHVINPPLYDEVTLPIPVDLKAGNYIISATYTDQHGLVSTTAPLTELPIRPCDVMAC